MKLVIASNNGHKVREIKEILGNHFEIFSQQEAGINLSVEEDGETFEENAVKKAEETLLAAGDEFEAALADDSGLMVDALGGAPGVYSARYAGKGHDDEENNDKLLRDMLAVPDEKRTCRFASAIALARRGRETLCVIGYCEGRLLHARAGENGFGYDPLFYYEPLQKSFAELSAEQKNEISHRRLALAKLEETLQRERICE